MSDAAKYRFVREFLTKCAAVGLTTPDQLARAAEALATSAKQASLGAAAGGAAGAAGALATYGPIIGHTLPILGGAMVGGLAAAAQNASDRDDARVMRLAALANAYRRRAAETKTHAEVRRVVESDPGKYVVIG